MANDREAKLEELLSEGLDLCVRARQMDAQDRRTAALAVSSDPKAWQADGTFDRYIKRHNQDMPDRPISTRSGTLPLWIEEQYQTDLVDWERRARGFLLAPYPVGRLALAQSKTETGERDG